MSTQTKNAENAQKALSEKARRLLAAHDREVSQFRRETAVEAGAHAYRMAG